MKAYYRVMLGRKSAFAVQGFVGGYVGADFLPGWTLAMIPHVAFYRYEIRFKLVKS